MIIHQMLPNFSYGDAIGDDTLALQRIFRALGHESDIYAGVIHSYLVDNATHWKRHKAVSHADNLLVYHFSVGSEIAEYLLQIPDRLVLVFHNITPPRWFFGVSPHMVELAVDGYEQLKLLRDRTEVAWADSEYNASILRELGYERVEVLPIIIDFSRLELTPNAVFARQWRSSQTTWFFAGRVSPNKCHEDIIRGFKVYKEAVNPHSRLILTGDVLNCARYANGMIQLVRDLHIPDVFFTGMIDDDELAAMFKMADVFVCMSEHEGFCVPLLEAMHYDVPVVAYDAGAVGSTLGGSGVLLKDKHPVNLAGIVDQILTDENLRVRIVNNQRRRLLAYQSADYQAQVAALLAGLKR